MSMGEPDFVPHDGKKDLVIPRFHIVPVKNNVKSEAEGRAVFQDMEMVEIIIPGYREATINRFVKQEDRDRWPTIYAAFKANQTAPSEGTPIREWAAISASQAEELAYFNIRTVEALAELGDGQLQKVVPMGGHALREKAKAWLEQAKGGAPMAKLQDDLERSEAARGLLEAQVAELASRLAELEKKRMAEDA